MTKNEQIAKVMGWECPDPDSLVPFYDYEWFDLSDMNYVKKLQQRMVDDGFEIQLNFDKSEAYQNNYMTLAEAFITIWDDWDKSGKPKHITKAFVGEQTESAAIVELFCKVYAMA